MIIPRPKSFRERMLDPRNRRSTHIEDRRSLVTGISPLDSAGYPANKNKSPNLNESVALRPDVSAITPRAARFDRLKAEMAQMEPYVPAKKRGLKGVRLK